MKILLFFTVVLSLSSGVFSQKVTPTANYNDAVTKKVKGLVTTYTSQSGESFTVGDTIRLGPAFAEGKQYSYVFQNAGIEFYPVPNTAVNATVIIKKIKIQSKKARVNTTKIENYTYGLMIILEDALNKGELKSKIMTSEEALFELKKAKDKLDLGIITQEEFNALRTKLAPLIK